MVKPDWSLAVPAQQGLLGLSRTLQQFAPYRSGDSVVQAIALRGGADAAEDDGDPFRIPNPVRIALETRNFHHLTLARGHEPHQDDVNPVNSFPQRRQFTRTHRTGLSPTLRAPAAACR